MKSFQIIVDGEPVSICFKSLKTGLKVARALREALPEAKTGCDSDYSEQMRYVRCVSSFALQQPTFVDIFSNQLDHQVSIPGLTMARTQVASMDHASVQDILSVQQKIRLQSAVVGPSSVQQQSGQRHGLSGPGFEGGGFPVPLQQPQMPHKPRQMHHGQVGQTVTEKETQQEQIYRIIYQILIQVFSKEPQLLMQASLQTGIRLDKGDPQQLSTLVKAMTQRLMRFPTHQMLEKLQEFQNIPQEMKERVQELAQQAGKPPTIPLQAPPRINFSIPPPSTNVPMKQPETLPEQQTPGQKTQPPPQLTPTRIQQAAQVMSQLEPSKISQLIHGQPPISMQRTQTYLPLDCNCIKYTAKPTALNPPNGLIKTLIETWKTQVLKHKGQSPGESELSSKILKLYEKQAEHHAKTVSQHELRRFHRAFSQEENLLLLVKVREKLSAPENQQPWAAVGATATSAVQLQVFDLLQKLVEQHKNSQSTVGLAAQYPVKAEPVKARAPQQAVQQSVPQQTVQQSVPQNVAESQWNTAKAAVQAPKQIKLEPIEQQPKTVGNPTLSPEFQQQVRQIFVKLINSVDQIVITKALLLIIGTGNSCDLNQTKTHVFFENGLMAVARSSQFDTSQEKLFIIVTGLIPEVVKVMQAAQVQGKALCYKIQQETLPQFDQFYEQYLQTVQQVNAAPISAREKIIAGTQYALFSEDEIKQMLVQCSEKTQAAVAAKIGISQNPPDKIKKEDAPPAQKKVSSGFGVERSETESDEL